MKIKAVVKKIYFGGRQFVLRLLFGSRRKTDLVPNKAGSILVIRIDRIGDLVVSLPAVKMLREAFPRATLSVLASRRNAALLACVPFIDEVLIYTNFIKTARCVRKKRYDIVIDLLMDYPVRGALLAHTSGAPFTAGFDVAGRGFCFNCAPAPDPARKYVGDYMIDLMRAVLKGLPGGPSLNESICEVFSITAQERIYVKSLLKERGVKEQDLLIGIHPGAYYPSQRWPSGKFAELADIIIERYGATVIIIGSPQERALVDAVKKGMRSAPIDIVGLPLDKLVALIAMLNVFVCNNSGPLHIAAALKVATVSTMGPTDPVMWRPRGEHGIVIRKDTDCGPCGRARCALPFCMNLIAVEEMAQAVEQQVQRRRHG